MGSEEDQRENLINILSKSFSKHNNIKNILRLTEGEYQVEMVYEFLSLMKKEGIEIAINRLKNNNLLWSSPIFKEQQEIIMEENTFSSTPREIKEGILTCGKCKSREIFKELKQTRSLDEPMTTFAECSKCGYKWKE